MKKEQRHGTTRKITTDGAERLSDHRQVISCREARKWRNDNTKKPEINCEKQNNEETATRYRKVTEEKMQQMRAEITGKSTNWK